MRTFAEWLYQETDVPPSGVTPPTYPAQQQPQQNIAQNQGMAQGQQNQQSQLSDVAKQGQAQTFFGKFIDSMKNLPASQWEIYLNQLTKTYEDKFKKNWSHVKSVAQGSAANIVAAQNKLDKQQMNVPVVGGAPQSAK